MENNENKIEKYLLEELMEKKEEIKRLRDERDNCINAFNTYRIILIEIVKKWKFEDTQDTENKIVDFGPISSQENSELYNALEQMAKELGVLPNEQ